MREFTQEEIQAITESEAVLRDAGFDVDHEHASANANVILAYFQKNPSVPVTTSAIYALVNANKDRFVWRTPAQREYDKIARENPTAAAQLSAWLETQGRPGQLVNDGSDQAFENSSLLLVELRGREINSQRIHEATGRIAYKPGRQLHYIPTPRAVDPRSHADDGGPFLGRNVNLTPADHKRLAREAAEKANPQSTPTKPTGPVDAWEDLCNQLLRFGSHSAQANMRELLERGIQQRKSFREIYAEMNALKKSYERLLPTAKY